MTKLGLTELGWPLFALDTQDREWPTIVKLSENDNQENGKTFGTAKEELLAYIRSQRDHWAALLREAKSLTQDDVAKE